jgi:hypothetical protein
MADLTDREHGSESMFAHDEELKFRAMARRDKLLGLWAAEKNGLSGAEAEAYAAQVVIADFEEPGEEDVFRKVRADLPASISDHQIRHAMEELMTEAMDQLRKG